MFVKRAAIRRLQRKYGSLWRDVVRIVTINISFMQINASLPSIMNGVAWPNNYLSFLNRFDVLNLDLMKFFGLPCVNDTLDYRFNVFVALFVPIVIVLLASFMYCLRRRQIGGSAGKIAKDSDLRRTSAEFLFDTLDADDGGNIEVEEFQQLLVYLGKKKVDMSMARKMMHQVKAKSPRPVNTTRRQQRQQRQQQVNGGKNSRSGSSVDELTREEFIRVVVDGSLETITRTGAKWVAVVELERTKASYQAAVLVVLLLMHAPVSQRFFYYFADDNVQGKRYLRSDYSIEYGGKIWSEFLPVVIVLGVCFVSALPLTIGTLLWRARHRFYSPHTKRKLGFLYRPFAPGAEFWELHEVLRKLLLTGVLIYVPPNARAAAAVLVCVLAVATLNYVQPHKNRVVFWVAEMAFLLTCFKYLSAIFVVAQVAGELVGESNQVLGVLLILIDVSMMLGSMAAVMAVAVLLKRHAKELRDLEIKEAKVKGEKSVSVVPMPGGDEGEGGHSASMTPAQVKSWKAPVAAGDKTELDYAGDGLNRISGGWANMNHNKIIVHAQASKVEEEAAKAHAMAVAAVKKQSKEAHSRLETRLKKRQSLRSVKGGTGTGK